MADHQELVTEMGLLEKMSTQDRLKLAKKRRIQQLKKWSQREKEFTSKRKKNDSGVAGRNARSRKCDYKVHFVPSVMLLEAAARNDIDEVRRLLMLGVSPDSTNEDGLTALHQCCIDDSEEMMKLLIEFGANVNSKDSEQWTPLHAAATCGHLHLVKYLIAKGADLLAVNADANMAYDITEDEVTLDFIESEMAQRGITQEMIDETRASTENVMLADLKVLVKSGEDLEFRDALGATPLHIASANGYFTVVEFLLDNHVSTDVVDNDLWQPVHAAACWGHPDVLEILVQAGADLQAKTKNGETPLDICEDPELKERIIQLKSEMETKKASHTNKLKRSHSSNTRSQSVRRTSIREKSQISRREAREEARLRQEKQETRRDDEDESKLALDIKEYEKETPNSSPQPPPPQGSPSKLAPVDLNAVELLVESPPRTANGSSTAEISGDEVSLLPSGHAGSQNSQNAPHRPEQQHKEAVVIRNTGFCERDSGLLAKNNNAVAVSSQGASSVVDAASSLPNSTTRSSSGESVKVEIHVTVNTTPSYGTGTLADLKKQRADLRHRGSGRSSPEEVASPKHVQDSTAASPQNHANGGSSHLIRATYRVDGQTPPSPSSTLKKFRGDPSEVVGDIHKKGCCTIS